MKLFISLRKRYDMKNNYSFLKDLRKSRGMTQTQVGYLAGMGKAQISRMERGSLGSIETISRVLDALGYKPIIDFQDTRRSDGLNTETILSILKVYYTNNFIGLGIENLGLFGSFARGEQTDKSDIDILITLKKPSLFLYGKIKSQLESVLKRKVDLISSKSRLNESFKRQLEKEVIYVS